jgi:hypothetical protein
MTNFESLISALEALKEDAEKFYVKGNSAAGTRVRKGLQAVKKQIKTVRDEITAMKEAKKTSA